MSSSVLVTGAGENVLNGIYTYRGVANGKSVYTLQNRPTDLTNFYYSIFRRLLIAPLGNIPGWAISGGGREGDTQIAGVNYYASDIGNEPWEVQLNQYYWQNYTVVPLLDPAPSVTELLTYDLPPDVVSLIVSRHGSVTNFLRLRNQGQI